MKVDLEKCLTQLKETGEIQSFDIASRDLCDRLIIPDKLYGREAEVKTLLDTFDRVSQSATEMMLITGFSGIGKTAVVNEVHKPIVRQRGYFIKGKYDQLQRNIPFSAFVQAFRDLMGQLLTENDIQIERWKNKVLDAVGENGQVIIEVIPELERIISKQPPAVELSGIAAQNRFNLLFQKFTQVFTSAEQPLENSLITGAFTSDRVEILNLICAQAAISLENARLYESAQEYAQKLEQSFVELSASNSRFHNLVDNVPGVVYQFSVAADGEISLPYISADCYKLYEIPAEQAIANVQTLLDLVHPEDAANHQQSIADSMQTLTPWQWTGRIVTPSGIVKWIHGEARIQKLVDGAILWDGLLLDISEQQAALRERKRAEQELQQAQLQIIQSEKMSALGNLVAGVAHEMNNPLGFIAATLKQTKPNLADLTEHLKLYQAVLENPSDEIQDHAEEIDLEYLLADLPKTIDAIVMACDRLKNISTSLRTFSRTDKDYKVQFNIHEGIDSTILILKHRLKANEQRPAIEVINNYGDLPLVNCFPGQLNQVFMNILANAIDALEEANIGKSFAEIKAYPNRITITTSIIDHQYVKISIADNGKGMSAEVQEKIFDHLFTTKEVSKGTGLGLAIARQIVEEKHGGKNTVNSVLGEGTEFIISLPI